MLVAQYMFHNHQDSMCMHVLQWLEKDFLGYLKKWEDSVSARDDVTAAQKPRMLLSKETREGLHITGILSFG